MEAVKGLLYRKETLLWTPLLVDVGLAIMIYPTFYSLGPKAMADAMSLNEQETQEMEQDKRVNTIWEITMIAYTGYFGLLLSSTYSCYYYPKTRPATGAAMLSLMFAKLIGLGKVKKNDHSEKYGESKKNSLYFFYLPFYGGYCLLNLYQWYQSRK
eukprot:444726_1